MKRRQVEVVSQTTVIRDGREYTVSVLTKDPKLTRNQGRRRALWLALPPAERRREAVRVAKARAWQHRRQKKKKQLG